MGQTEACFTITDGGAVTAANTSVELTQTITNCDWAIQPVWYPSTYYSYWPAYQPDKTRQAFEIVKLLEERKYIKLTSVKKFVGLVDEIYKIL